LKRAFTQWPGSFDDEDQEENAVNKLRTRIAAGVTVIGLGGLAGVALSAGQKSSSATVAEKPVVRTKVIRRTIHVTKHAKSKHPAWAGPGGRLAAGGRADGVAGAYGSATTGTSSSGSPPQSSSSYSSPVTTSTSGSSSVPTESTTTPVVTHTSGASAGSGSSGSSSPVTTATSGGGGGGGEVEHESHGGGDD